MAEPLIAQDAFRERRRRCEVWRPVQREHRRELLSGKRMLLADSRLLDQQEPGLQKIRPVEAGTLRETRRGLCDELRTKLAALEHRLFELPALARIEPRTAHRLQSREQRTVDGVDRDDTVLRRA